MKIAGYPFQSCFAPYIEKFLREKRDAGFLYESEEWKLKHFDAFCVAESVTKPILGRELVKKWGTLREMEALSTCAGRMSVLRQFALFLTSLGLEAYIPAHFYKAEKKIVHILSDDEMAAFFQSTDCYTPAVNALSFHRLSTEYKVIFRLIYCCGLRISALGRRSFAEPGRSGS